MSKRSMFHIESRMEADRLVLQLSGIIDENANLTPLTSARAAEIRLELSHVQRINSFGVRAWLEAVRSIPSSCRLVLAACSTAIVDQCNMVAEFHGHGVIESFYAPLICESCGEETQVLFATADCRARGGVLPEIPCPRCQRVMDIDDLAEQYLAFLRSA